MARLVRRRDREPRHLVARRQEPLLPRSGRALRGAGDARDLGELLMSTPPGEPVPSRHERVKQLFLDALDAPRGRRVAFLASACAGDEQIRREVLELFLLHGEDDPVLDAPLDGAEALASLAERPEGVVGPYRLLRELGRGGMG